VMRLAYMRTGPSSHQRFNMPVPTSLETQGPLSQAEGVCSSEQRCFDRWFNGTLKFDVWSTRALKSNCLSAAAALTLIGYDTPLTSGNEFRLNWPRTLGPIKILISLGMQMITSPPELL
jgi:hypothetical protein